MLSGKQREAILAGKTFTVRVARGNESANKSPEFTVQATSLTVSEDGSLQIETQEGGQSLGATTWGAVVIERVPNAAKRL